MCYKGVDLGNVMLTDRRPSQEAMGSAESTYSWEVSSGEPGEPGDQHGDCR